MFNDEKRLRDALKKAEKKNRAIFDESSDGIMLIEKNTGAIVDFNENMLSILGCSHEEIPSLDVRK
ncbi:MAG TPA: PAS domain-containing protein, partial [Victivallales bacterium]|nr:PAS domain-containing protein [Victivallales bacterium]